MAQSGMRLLVFSELYYPHVGGSVRWIGKIAEHWPGPARVLAGLTPAGSARGTRRDGPVNVQRIWLRMQDWGLDSVRTAAQYVNAVYHLALASAGPSRPDVIICGRGVPEGFVALLAGRATGVPYACLVHGEEVTACRRSGQLRLMLRAAYGGAACVICNSRNSARLAREAGADDRSILVSHPGVDVRAFRGLTDRPPRPAEGPVVLITVGRLDERKNHAAVLGALARLRSENLDVRYVIAGDGPMRQRLVDLSRSLGVDEWVTWIFAGSDENITEAYSQADIFVMPATIIDGDLEGFGIVYIEAALAAMPSVAGAHGGCREAVLDNRTGLVVDGFDDEAVTRAIRTLVVDAAKRRALGLEGRRRAIEQFDWRMLIPRMARDVAERAAGKDRGGQSL